MPRSLLTVRQAAASLHISEREVVRMAERGVLPAMKVKGAWHFRAGELWNWIDENMTSLAARREKDRDPAAPGDLLIAPALRPDVVALNLAAKTKASVLREMARLAERVEPTIDAAHLVEALTEREAKGSTALESGVAIPHPGDPIYCEGPVIVAARTGQGVVFGERRGGLTDLFFLVCCPTHADHLLYLGRLCRLLIEPALREALRSAGDPRAFIEALERAETALAE